MIEIYNNNASTTLASALPASGVGSTTISVASGTGALFPTPGSVSPPAGATSFFRLSLTDSATQTKHEIVYITAVSGDNFTAVRGQDGTTAQAWNAGDICGQFVVAGSENSQLQVQQAQAGYLNYTIATASGNALSANLTPLAIQSLTAGLPVRIMVPSTNTGSVTLNLAGFGVQPVVNKLGLSLVSNELLSGVVYDFVWDGSRWVVGTLPSLNLYLVDASSTPNLLTVTTSLPLSGIGLSTVLYVKVANTNTSSVFIKVNSLSNISVVARDGSNLQSGALVANNTYRLLYNGTVFVSDISNAASNVINEVRMWSGNPSNISTSWGPGWQLADGTNGTPDLRNRFIVGAGSTYTVGSTGGGVSTTLSVAQLPSHTHSITDSGHAHGIKDPGHAHSINDPGHTHGINQSPHSHGVSDPGHAHSYPDYYTAFGSHLGHDTGGDSSDSMAPTSTTRGTYASGTGIGIQAQYANVSNTAASTGIGIYGNTTGITANSNTTGITVQATGSGSSVPTLPPYYALCYVIYTG